MRSNVLKLLAGGVAAASLMTFSAPVYAAAAAQSPAQAEAAGWCEIVPTFCGNHCGNTARCNPCAAPGAVGVKAREAQICAAKRED